MTLPKDPPWNLPAIGFEVLTIVFARQLEIVAYGDGASTMAVRYNAAFSLTEADGQRHALNGEDTSWQALAAHVLALRHDRIAVAIVSETAALHIALRSGRTLDAAPDGGPYEHWEVTSRAPDYKLVALPGDGGAGVATWDGED